MNLQIKIREVLGKKIVSLGFTNCIDKISEGLLQDCDVIIFLEDDYAIKIRVEKSGRIEILNRDEVFKQVVEEGKKEFIVFEKFE